MLACVRREPRLKSRCPEAEWFGASERGATGRSSEFQPNGSVPVNPGGGVVGLSSLAVNRAAVSEGRWRLPERGIQNQIGR